MNAVIRERLALRIGAGVLLALAALQPAWAQDAADDQTTAGETASQDEGTGATAGETGAAPAQAFENPPDVADVPTVAVPQPAAEPVAVDDRTRLDEITVTAQKRGVQLIKDVPISISVVDDEMIFDWGITNVREVMLFVPNVKVEEAGYFMIPRIRGFTTNNNNKAFEPPAGVAIDGIPYGRVEYFNAGLFDINRVEVMRGPQGTTFGKNTTAGLIHIISKDPTDEFKGFVDIQRGQYERERVEFGLGGRVIEDVVNIRVAGMTDSRRGYISNTTAAVSQQANKYLQGRDNGGIRVKLGFPSVLGTSGKLSYEKLELGSLGTGIELIDVTDTMAATLRKYDPNVDLVGGNQIASLDYPDGRLTDIETINGDWGVPIGPWNLAIVGGQSVMNTSFHLDTDFSPAPGIIGKGADRAPTTTLELRALSPSFEGLFGLGDITGWGDSDILIGAFAQRTNIEDGYFYFAFPYVGFLDLTAAAEGSGGTDEDPPLMSDIFGIAPPNEVFLEEGVTDEVTQWFDQHSDTVAMFSQLQWRFLPGWTAQVGGRYSQEKKDALWNSVIHDDSPGAIVQAAGITEFVATRKRKDDYFQPKISMNWQPTEALSLFAHWARSFKSGGFNAFAFRAVEDQLVYHPEYTNEWGFDVKGTFFDRRLKLNLSSYRMDVDDFQVLTREDTQDTIGLGLTKVVNAAKARAQGIEGDITWLASSWMRLFVTLGLNDTEYLDFPINDCAPDRDNTDGDADPRCDASGKPFAFAPKYNGTITAGFIPPFTLAGLGFDAGLSAEYASWQHTDIDLDDRKIQDAYWRYRATLGFGNLAQGWSFKLIGENLTDEITYIRKGDLAPKQFVGITEPPRQIYGQFRWTF